MIDVAVAARSSELPPEFRAHPTSDQRVKARAGRAMAAVLAAVLVMGAAMAVGVARSPLSPPSAGGQHPGVGSATRSIATAPVTPPGSPALTARSSLPPGLAAAIARHSHPAHRRPAPLLVGYRDDGSVRVTTPDHHLISLTPATLGRGSSQALAAPVLTTSRGGRTYDFGALSVSYRRTRRGLEQIFTVGRRPAGSGTSVDLVLATHGARVPQQTTATSVQLRAASGSSTLTYSGLRVTDAVGRVLPARLGVTSGGVQITVDDQGATYPLTIDPWIELTSLAPTAVAGSFGAAVALSGDGLTALVGDPSGGPAGVGEATVFSDSTGTWSPGTALDVPGTAGSFGSAVALSSMGTVALVGDPTGGPGSTGAAAVYTLSSGGTWSPGTALAAPSSAGNFGTSVSLSSNGQVAIVGDPNAGLTGATTVFRFGGTDWDSGTALPPPTGATEFGTAATLSGDGNTAIVGDPAGGTGHGAVTAYRYNSTTSAWSALTAPAVPSTAKSFGQAVALSSNGNTALVGDPSGGSGTTPHGAATSFSYNGSSWKSIALPTPSAGSQWGAAVSLSSAGTAALVSDPGDVTATYTGVVRAYTLSGSTWSVKSILSPAGSVQFGSSVSMSSSGTLALAGDPSASRSTLGIGLAGVSTLNTSTQLWSNVTQLAIPAGPSSFGTAVAVSSDGSTAVVGDPTGSTDGNGAATVYGLSGGGWSGGTPLLEPATAAAFGSAVALSGDGLTALIGDPSGGTGSGTATIYTRSGENWSTGTALTVPTTAGNFGTAVALNSDGTVAVVGDPTDGANGAVTVYNLSGGIWSAGTELAPPPGSVFFGDSLGVSANGNTVLVGDSSGMGNLAGEYTGKASVFTYDPTSLTWSAGTVLVPPTSASAFGAAVALSADGNTALVGDSNGGSGRGAATVYTFDGSSWSAGSPLNPPATSSHFGAPVALSPDATSALVGDPGAAGGGAATGYSYTGSSWSAPLPLVRAAGAAAFGTSVALSTGGRVALVGDPGAGITGATTIYNVDSPVELALTSIPLTGAASSSAVLGPVTVETQDASGNPVEVTTDTTVTLSSTSAGAVFAATSGGPATTTVTIPAGSSDATFFYGDTQAGTPTLGVQASSLTAASQAASITPARASQLVFTTVPTTATVGTSFAIALSALDPYGNPTPRYAGTVQVTSSDKAAQLPVEFAFVAGQSGMQSVTLESAGTQLITATDASDPSVTGTAYVSVSQATSSTTASVNPTSASVGDSVTYSATVSGGGPTPGGSVTFSIGGTPLCGPVNLVAGAASCAATSAPLGADTVTANYSGDANYQPSSGTARLSVGVPPLSITTSSLPAGAVGVAYSAPVAATGGTTPYTWSVSGGSLPTGLSLDAATGTISGNPAVAGTASFTVTATDAGAQMASADWSITIGQGTASVSTSVNPSSAYQGQSVTYSATVGGGGLTPGGSVTFSIGGTTMCGPVDLVSGAASCAATIAPAGVDTVTADYSGDTNYQPANTTTGLSVTIPTLSISTASLPAGAVGIAYSAPVTATGGTTPYTWSVSGGSLPAGLSLDAATGTISGNPAAAGTASFTVTATDAGSQTAAAELSITIGQGTASVSAAVNPTGATQGQSVTYSATVGGGGPTPGGSVTFSIGGTTMCGPVDLVSGAASCATAAAPLGADTVTAAYSGDANYQPSSVTTGLNVTVPAFGISTTSLPGGTIGTAYSATVAATGGTTPYAWKVSSGSLPAGLHLSATTGSITGIPTALGTSVFTIHLADKSVPARTAQATFSITVAQGSPTLTLTGGTHGGYGAKLTLTATLTHTSRVTPDTGTISFSNDGNDITGQCDGGTGPLVTATHSVCTLGTDELGPVGTYSLVATDPSDTNYLAARSSTIAYQVTRTNVAVGLVLSPSPVARGESVTATATLKLGPLPADAPELIGEPVILSTGRPVNEGNQLCTGVITDNAGVLTATCSFSSSALPAKATAVTVYASYNVDPANPTGGPIDTNYGQGTGTARLAIT